ncbi:MAG: exonuclease SbcCD subunit D [Oscillospiraceae bacterium]|nr:exonuclease SbcCD subunit D [Oscillospiraceae bacterium]
MKWMHLSDLHLGKRVNGFPMLEDQRFVLEQILTMAREEQVDAALLCGDIYDKSVPSAEAVECFDDFLSRLAEICPVYLISGNHDSAERLAFGGRLMTAARVYVSPVYDGTVRTVQQEDDHGTVCFHLLPFLKPVQVRPHFPDLQINSYTDAVRAALSGIDQNDGKRHVLLAHQFVTGALPCESEEKSVGGSDNVDAQVFEGFDYVALGHLHGPQRAGGDHIRYCGTMLKYSFSEVDHRKSVTFVRLEEKGELTITTRPLTFLHDMKVIRGSYEQLMDLAYYHGTDLPESYLHIVLTDEEPVPEALYRLRTVYKNIMKLTYDNTRTRQQQNPLAEQVEPEMSPLALFGLLYEKQNNRPLSPEQTEYMEALIGNIWKEAL